MHGTEVPGKGESCRGCRVIPQKVRTAKNPAEAGGETNGRDSLGNGFSVKKTAPKGGQKEPFPEGAGRSSVSYFFDGAQFSISLSFPARMQSLQYP